MRSRLLAFPLVAVLALAGCGGTHHAPSVQHQIRATGETHILPNGKPAPKDWQIHGGRPRAPGFGQPPRGDFGLAQGGEGFSAVYTVQGYDAVDVWRIPLRAIITPCYISGSWPNCTAMAQHEPGAVRPTIATNRYHVGRWLDVEPGDAVASDAGVWAHSMIYNYHIYRPGIYASASTMGSVKYWLGRAGLSRSQYLLWIADWDYNSSIPAGYDAKQYIGGRYLDYDRFGSWTFSPPPPSVDTHSYREGFVTGYATGRSAPYKTGFLKTFRGFVPKVQKDYDSGWSAGWKSGHRTAYNLGLASGRKAPVSPTSWSGSWNLGYDKCWAGAAGLGVGGNFWTGFAVTKHGSPSSWAAYGSGCAKGKPSGYNWDRDNGSRSGSYYTYSRLG